MISSEFWPAVSGFSYDTAVLRSCARRVRQLERPTAATHRKKERPTHIISAAFFYSCVSTKPNQTKPVPYETNTAAVQKAFGKKELATVWPKLLPTLPPDKAEELAKVAGLVDLDESDNSSTESSLSPQVSSNLIDGVRAERSRPPARAQRCVPPRLLPTREATDGHDHAVIAVSFALSGGRSRKSGNRINGRPRADTCFLALSGNKQTHSGEILYTDRCLMALR